MTRKRRRLWLLLACFFGLGSATALSLAAFRNNLVFFVTPSDLLRARLAEKPQSNHVLRLGGLVAVGSLRQSQRNGAPIATFCITDNKHAITVHYAGILPDLFRERQGVVALGALQPNGDFLASEVLAKHDETYMPKDVADALKRRGEWRPDSGGNPPDWPEAAPGQKQ